MSEPAAVVPALVFHPSEYIREEMDAREWDLDKLASMMLGNHPHVDPSCAEAWGIIRLALDLYMYAGPSESGPRLDKGTARELERAFGIGAECWLRMDALYRDAPIERRARPDVEQPSDDPAQLLLVEDPQRPPSRRPS